MKELNEALKQCPPWLQQRISIQARNLLMLHRLEAAPVSPKTANTLLVTMGVLVAKIIFDQAREQMEALEAPAAEGAAIVQGGKVVGRITGGGVEHIKDGEPAPDGDNCPCCEG